MRRRDYEEDAEEQQPAREGVFDAQLTFPLPFVEAPAPLTRIVKRDGSTAVFERSKIADAIFRAAQSIGGTDRDRADHLASAVAIYLTKTLQGAVPAADQVDDAVEKVLIEMGHARTALAYARYRDRRARLRSLRAGDVHGLLNELREARRDQETPAIASTGTRLVRTSAETLSSWDCTKIVEALMRETGLDEGRANLIAIEVEQQLALAEVKILTASLIREMVGAKLIEHGLETFYRRHVRLGVPLYDAERIICGPHLDGLPQDPEATGRVLAESVKREFALSRVFTEEVAEAHVRGDLHLHDLGQVDRLHSAVHSLEHIARFGVGLRDSRGFSKPPRYADTLLAQMVNASAALQNHFSSAITWDAVNVFFAPFLDRMPEKDLRQVAQMLIYEFAYRAVTQGPPGPVTEIVLCWDAPARLKNAEAIGPGAAVLERSYGDYVPSARQFAWALLDVFREGGAGGASFPAPIPLVHIAPSLFKADGHDAFFDQVCKLAAARGNVHFLLDRADPKDQARKPWEVRDLVLQRITLNVARAAFRAGDEGPLFAELDRLVDMAAQAHSQKRHFIEELMGRKRLGSLALLASEQEGRSYLNLHRAACLIGLTGLNECVQHLVGAELHASDAAVVLALRIADHVQRRCELWSEHLDLRCVPAHTADAAVDHRFAAIDLQEFPDAARGVVKSDPLTHDLFYTSGACLSAVASVTPIHRARIEGLLHDAIPINAVTRIGAPDTDSEMSPRSIADFIRKAYHQTRNRRIVVTTS